MIYRVSGKLVLIADRFIVIETGGIGFKVPRSFWEDTVISLPVWP